MLFMIFRQDKKKPQKQNKTKRKEKTMRETKERLERLTWVTLHLVLLSTLPLHLRASLGRDREGGRGDRANGIRRTHRSRAGFREDWDNPPRFRRRKDWLH